LPKKDFGFGLYIKTFMERMCFKLAGKIIAVGHAQRKGILEKTSLHPDKIEIIQNGVDQKKFCRDIINQKREGRKKNKISIISVARISKVKNQLLILKAIAPLIKKGQNIQVSLVGQLEEKDYVTEINNFIDINNLQKNARLIGPVPNNLMPGYYQAADIFISASNAEGFPLTVLEAMSCGCAILLSSIEPHKEISKEGEILFFQQNNLAEISQVIESLIIDKKKLKLLKKLAANSAKKYYSWKKVALDNIRIYNQIRKI
jgi:glycosyltransferase involved in cell wall biosynthesis